MAAIQLYGLIFLMGSFTVASLSDLRRMAAQKDFAEVWALFTLILFSYDIYLLGSVSLLLLKWSLILAFVLVAVRMSNRVSISIMDIAAICAAISLLDPLQIITYFVILIVIKGLTSPILRRFGEGDSYPFLPVVWITTAILLGILALNVLDFNL